ncbi:RICIN domain-containing protein [Actinacidiphila glaucinigra]|uniref:Ricin-type beta-trefoil lectin domain-containing protein n=1 Tax=Actinacidiphila glaucinigra TaxID=235986 RepID=A0A239IHJ9_9ACTN|nr:RICIN domain-containing protein [Actinacidiphila glaucinigra]SNS93031.1 Ricin-type beta-trefoil lectin domain-containing protein [Actinacidiphila glaucinigra]
MRKKSWAAMATGVLAVATLAAGTPSASAVDIYSRVANYKSGRCLSLEGGGGTANGTDAILWDCGTGHEQYWFHATPSGEIRNLKSGKCLSLDGGGGTANGTKVILWDCNGRAEQAWDYSGGHQWYNEKAGRCMSTAGGGGTANGTKVIIYNCIGSDEQDWDYIG